MTIKIIICVSTLLFILTGCDPGKVIIIKTANKPNVSVTLYADSAFFPNFSGTNQSKIVLRVPSREQPSKRDTLFMYGIGSWSDKSINDIATHIDSIIIQKSRSTINLKSKSDIIEYLTSHTGGYVNSIILIEAD